MQSRISLVAFSSLIVALTAGTAAHAELLCPTRYQLDVPKAPQAATTVGPGKDNRLKSGVLALLTKSKATCTVRPPSGEQFAVIHEAVALLGGARTHYLDVPWEEVWAPSLQVTQRRAKRATATQVTTASSVVSDELTGVSASGLNVVFDCASQPAVAVRVSATGWSSTTSLAVPVDVSLREIPSSGSFRLFDVTCHYRYPAVVGVDLPRRAPVDERVVTTNLTKVGFYGASDMSAAIREKLCARDCSETFMSPLRRSESLGLPFEQCRASCVEGGF